MNTALKEISSYPKKGLTLSSLALSWVLTACSPHNSDNHTHDYIPEWHHHANSNIIHHDHPPIFPEIHPGHLEWQVFIDTGIKNASIWFFDQTTKKFISWLEGINTDSTWRALFDLSSLQGRLQWLWNRELTILPTGTEHNYSSRIKVNNGTEHIISNYSHGVAKIISADDMPELINQEITHSPSSLIYWATALAYPQEVINRPERFDRAVARVLWYTTEDITNDWVFDHSDINKNHRYSQYANDCMVINPDWSLSVHFIPPEDLYNAMEYVDNN